MVLFTSDRPLIRAENIKAVYDAFDGEKEFINTDPWHYNPEVASKKYKLRVTDEFINSSPGKAIMIGHGICGGKYFGLDQPYPYFRKENAHLLNCVISTSEKTRSLVAKQSGVKIEKVLPLGMPRTDAYFGKKKGDGKTFIAKKRSYLYAPTFRNWYEPKLPSINWDLIDQILTDDEMFIVKSHMISNKILTKTYNHIFEVSPSEPSTPFLIDCDVLITDYSSIMFDAHLLNKPVILFEKSKGYVDKRGMYLKYPDEYASRYCTNERDLINELRSAFNPGEADIRCKEFTASSCDGHSTERVIELIKEII